MFGLVVSVYLHICLCTCAALNRPLLEGLDPGFLPLEAMESPDEANLGEEGCWSVTEGWMMDR
jgi:hypothetical protein